MSDAEEKKPVEDVEANVESAETSAAGPDVVPESSDAAAPETSGAEHEGSEQAQDADAEETGEMVTDEVVAAEKEGGDVIVEDSKTEPTETSGDAAIEQVEAAEDEADQAPVGEDEEMIDEDADPLLDLKHFKPILERRDRSLKELLEDMNQYSPIIPDAVTDYYLSKAGFKTSDVRIKRLLALATQKFIGDIATDAYQYARTRSQSGVTAAGGTGQVTSGGLASGAGGIAGGSRGRPSSGYGSSKAVLTMEILSSVLSDYGVNAKRPDFYR